MADQEDVVLVRAAEQSEAFRKDHHGNPLRATLSTWDLTAIGVGGIIGAGVYVLGGQAAARYAGPGIILSFILSGFACIFIAFSYSELATMIPKSGSAYSFATVTLGQAAGFLIGWFLQLEYLTGASAVAVGWSSYFASLLNDMGAGLPVALTSSPFAQDAQGAWHSTGGVVNLPAIAIVALMTWINVVGVRESATVNTIVVVLKSLVLVAFVLVGAAYVKPSNWEPFIPPASEASPGTYGWQGIFRGSSVIMFSYIGFDGISTVSQEAKDPQRSLPIATIGSLLVCTILYIAVSLVMTGLVPYTQLDVADPIAVAVNATGISWLAGVIKAGALLGLTSVIMVLIMGEARICFAMAEDGLLPAFLHKVHPTRRTPVNTTLLTGVLASLISGLLPMSVIAEMVSGGTLIAFATLGVGLIRFRKTDPHLPRPFRTPWVPYVPALGTLCSLVQLVSLPGDTWLRLVIWLVLGLLVYYFYARKHAKPYAERRAQLLGLAGGSRAGAEVAAGLLPVAAGAAVELGTSGTSLHAAAPSSLPSSAAAMAAGTAGLLSTEEHSAGREAADIDMLVTLVPEQGGSTAGLPPLKLSAAGGAPPQTQQQAGWGWEDAAVTPATAGGATPAGQHDDSSLVVRR